MQKVEIWYNPCKRKATIEVDGDDVCELKDYQQFAEMLEMGMLLQTWAEPFPEKEWKGLINELREDKCFEIIEIVFHGPKTDFEDLKRVCEAENEKRMEKLKITYEHRTEMPDESLCQNMDRIMEVLYSEEFAGTVLGQGKDSQISKNYQRLKEEYEREYAWPFLMRNFKKYFDALCRDIKQLAEEESRLLEGKKKELDKEISEDKLARFGKYMKEREIKKLTALMQEAGEQKEAVGEICFDKEELKAIKTELRGNCIKNYDIVCGRCSNRRFSLTDINKEMDWMEKIFSEAWDRACVRLEALISRHKRQLSACCDKLKEISERGQENDSYGLEECHFRTWPGMEKAGKMDADVFRRHVEFVLGREVECIYKVEELRQELNQVLGGFKQFCTEIEKEYDEDIEKIRAWAETLERNIAQKISSENQTVLKLEKQIVRTRQQGKALEKEMEEIRKKRQWLQELARDMETAESGKESFDTDRKCSPKQRNPRGIYLGNGGRHSGGRKKAGAVKPRRG